jgi:hypothetical protein
MIASLLHASLDAESIGLAALGVYMNTSTCVAKLGHEYVHQLVGRTPRGYIVIADFGGGLVITISDNSETEPFVPLMPGFDGSPILT